MKKVIIFFQNKYLQWLLIAILILYQMIRIITFVNVYGGVETDGGWFLGTARSVAETGTYTSMVSTLPDPNVTADFDINKEFFQVQDKDGRVYFFVEGTVGPTQVFLDALIIKLFGSGFWQFRAASLLFYLLFLIVGSGLLFLTGGFFAVLLFHLYFFFYPHLSVFLGYEALGEVALVVCLIISYFLYAKATTLQKNKARWLFLSGLVAGLAILSKIIAFLALTSFGFLWLILYLQQKTTFKEGLIATVGMGSLPLIWELVQLLTITRLIGFDKYIQHAQNSFDLFLRDGSGLSNVDRTGGGIELFWYKFFLISEISHTNPVLSSITLLAVAGGGPFLMWALRKNQLHQRLVILLWGGWLAHTLWFITAAEYGWMRRYWIALVLAILILSLLWGVLLHKVIKSPAWFTWLPVLAMTTLIFLNFSGQKQAATFLLSETLVDYYYQKYLEAPHTRLPWIIIPRADQEAAVKRLQQLPSSAHVFYVENYKSPELAALSGRLLYPIQRRPLMSPTEDDVVIFGPRIISQWRKPTEASTTQAEQQAFVYEIIQRVKRECPNILFENDYYIICKLHNQ